MLVGLVIPALAEGQDESHLWSAKVGIMAPTSGGDAGIALGLERQLNSWAGSRSAIELDYAHPSDASDWYLLYNMRYHVNGGGYWGWGAGLNTMNLSDAGNSSTTTNFAYRVFYGQRWNQAFGEIGWLSGMKDGNSGLVLSIGTRF
jgi:hypothetical protein